MKSKEIINDFRLAGFRLKAVKDHKFDFKVWRVYSGHVFTGVMLIEDRSGCRISMPVNDMLRVGFIIEKAPYVEKGESISFGMFTIGNIYKDLPAQPVGNEDEKE